MCRDVYPSDLSMEIPAMVAFTVYSETLIGMDPPWSFIANIMVSEFPSKANVN